VELEVYYGEIQHGHMDQVGYDTYCKLLDEVIKEIQGIEVKEEMDVQIDLKVAVKKLKFTKTLLLQEPKRI